ncbi:chymotrypsin-1-like [Pararge aegeria]|uniref:chymotrypsin-1-like n=1 Tax=Pararge aegeria TaxID=116150 RepID=UPI0019D08A79|nr:chymotrypsin-1-like [Pararge aegeria]
MAERSKALRSVTSAWYLPSLDDGRTDWEKIVGGTKAANASAPYQVSLRMWGSRHFCGASIISHRVILTAAHCVDGMNFKNYKAVVGTNQLLFGGKSYSIRKVVQHKKYDPELIKNDIALIFTKREMEFSSTIQAIELNDEPVAPGEDLLLTGWGTTSYPGLAPNDLMQLELKAVSYEECKEAHQETNPVYETQICAISSAGKGACHGDSGGPLVREGRQVGIVSWGIPCAKGKPDVYTKVESYMDWIEKTLHDNNEDHLIHQKRQNSID